ncbi:MAG: ATP-binding protein [Roseburia sp.]|nr:ATP-binding protein [Roseburia sp.]
MNIKQAKQEIKNTVKAYLMKEGDGSYRIPEVRQRPILLMGPPGIGKTQIMEQIARECQIGLVSYTITHHTRQSAVGLPFIVEEEFAGESYSVTGYTMSEIIASVHRKMKDTGLSEGILFIDEINCVSETLAPTMLQFLQCKTFGNQKVPEGWIIVAAGNPPEYNKSVRDFDMVTLDRVRRMDIEADFSVWKEYARAQGVSNILLSYLELRPQNFYRVQADVDGMQFVTARGWEDLSELMGTYEKLGIPVTEEVVCQYVAHKEIAKDVAAYIDLYRKYEDHYDIPEILKGRVKAEVYQRLLQASFDEKLSLVNLLLSGLNRYFQEVSHIHAVTDGWFDFLKRYRQRLTEASSGEKGDALLIYEEMVSELEAAFAREKESGFLTREDERVRKEQMECIRQGKPEKEEILGADGDAGKIFDLARRDFAGKTEELEHAEKRAGDALEHAFDFMENAFADGQELVVFVTELTMGKASCAYLSENECARYVKYNKELLLGTKRAELMSEIETGNIRAEEHHREL